MVAETPPKSDKPEAKVIQEPRRVFIAKMIALVAWAAALVTPAAAGVVAFLNPLRVKGQAGEPLRLGSLEALPADGTPRKFPVIMDRTDAWNRFPKEPVGAVYLRRIGENELEAIHVVCPHAGCFVGYDAGKNVFVCPCHNATFDLSGKRLDATSPSPRDLDTLEVELRGGDEIWVKFQNFRTGIPQKVAEA
jgi:menaquinol-cytochrome c reductase iron-sulfur subunit